MRFILFLRVKARCTGHQKKTRVAKGDAIYIPGGTEHHITNTGKEPLRLLYIFDTDEFFDVEYNN